MSDFSRRLRKKLSIGVRKGLQQAQDRVKSFEEEGGWRGAAERVRVKTESRARDVAALLEQRGIHVERWLPITSDEEKILRGHYRTLRVDFGSDMSTVKSAYREMMREYHPDRHSQNPEAEEAATLMAQKISIAYSAIERYLKAHG